MTRIGNRESLLLLVGDVLTFVFSLWLTLLIRYEEIPSSEVWGNHIVPFSALFALWIVVFFILDLYGRQKLAFRRKLFGVLARAHVINNVIALVVFYFIPTIGIAPKVNFLLYSILSFVFIILWRAYVAEWVVVPSPEAVAILGMSEPFVELKAEFEGNPKYGYRPVSGGDASFVITDLYAAVSSEEMRRRYNAALSGVRFVDIRDMYSAVFDRLPISLLGEGWFLRNLPRSRTSYDILKRLMDTALALPLAVLSLLVYPFIALAIKLDDRGPVFIHQDRVGRGGKTVVIYKFRSMSQSDSGAEVLKSKAKITRVGAFLRKSRLDELPQLWSVVRGQLSLVGPRPELPALAEVYSKEIPHYDVRHTIKPGLSGWAQIYHEQHPHHGTAVEDTRDKLSYDLFYVKNRSFVLDLKIALKTLKILVSFVGR